MTTCPYGFRIVGATWEARRLVDATAALAGYAACDERADVTREAYLSAFQFGNDFRQLADPQTGVVATAGFAGPCWSDWLWFDIDRADLDAALKDARRLALALDGRYCPGDDDLLVFFSGSKGFHLGLPTALWSPVPSPVFHRAARRFAESVAESAGVAIDAGVYDRVRAFRAPNSRHPKTGLHKRRLTLDELTGLSLDAVLTKAKAPEPFDVPAPRRASDPAAADWTAAVATVTSESEGKAARQAAGNGSPTLNRSTLAFIRDGAPTGDRHRLLFSAAANLAEFGCSLRLAESLLEESALDAGLSPKEVRRQIECGLRAGWSGRPDESRRKDTPESTPETPEDQSHREPPERNTAGSDAITGQSCQATTGATDPKPAADHRAALARLWGSPPAPAPVPTEAVAGSPAPSTDAGRAVLPTLSPPLVPLPPGAVGSGKLDAPCRCGSAEYADFPISDDRTRRDCRRCGRFVDFVAWHEDQP